MKKRFLAGVLCVAMACAFVGCGSKEETKATEKETETVVEETEIETFKAIGTEITTEEGFCVKLKNSTGLDIVGVSVRTFDEPEFPASMLAEEDNFVVGEERMLYVKSVEEETDAENADPEAKLLTQGYDIQLTFADESVKVLHAFPFGDITEGEICLEDDVAFVKYVSVSTKETVSTKEAELAVKQEEEAAAAEEFFVEEDYYYEEDDYYDDDSWYEDDYDASWEDSGSPDAAEPEAPSQDSDNCLGDDALTW